VLGLVIHSLGEPGGWTARHMARRAVPPGWVGHAAKPPEWPTREWYTRLLEDPAFKLRMAGLRAPTEGKKFKKRWALARDVAAFEEDLDLEQMATRFNRSMATISRVLQWRDLLIDQHDREV